MRIFILCLLICCFSLPLEAGRFPRLKSSLSVWKRVEASVLRKLPALRRISANIPNSLLQVQFLTPAKPRVNVNSVQAHLEILPSLALPLDAEGFALGSGFVIRSLSGRFYAVAAYHVVGSAGKPASVRLFQADGQPVDYVGLKVSAGGSFGINAPDVSLIELPAEVKHFVQPLGVAAQPPQEGSSLFMWGRPYDAMGFTLAPGLAVASAYGMKIVLNRTQEIKFLEGMCGAPVLDENGLVTGIYGGRGGANASLFAIDARKSLSWLLKNYEGKGFTPYTFKAFGYTVLALKAGETLDIIEHRGPTGSLLATIDLPTYQGPFDPEHLENVFKDLQSGDVLSFEVKRGRIFSHFVFFKIP